MDMLTICASFVIKRLELNQPVNTVKDALETLFSVIPGEPAIIGEPVVNRVIKRFRKHKDLVPKLGSWLSNGSNIKLSDADVLLLIEQEQISHFAEEIHVQPQLATRIIGETIPMIVEKSLAK